MKIQTTCGRGDAHMEGIEGLPLTTRIRFTAKDEDLKLRHSVYSNGVRIRRRFPTRKAAQAWIRWMKSKDV